MNAKTFYIKGFNIFLLIKKWAKSRADSRSFVHRNIEKLAKSNGELLQCLLIGTPRKRLSLNANSRSVRSLEHHEIGKVK